MTAWQPIASAPKDGTDILVFIPDATDPPFVIAHWSACDEAPDDDDWYDTARMWPLVPEPSHWMPLPEPPK